MHRIWLISHCIFRVASQTWFHHPWCIVLHSLTGYLLPCHAGGGGRVLHLRQWHCHFVTIVITANCPQQRDSFSSEQRGLKRMDLQLTRWDLTNRNFLKTNRQQKLGTTWDSEKQFSKCTFPVIPDIRIVIVVDFLGKKDFQYHSSAFFSLELFFQVLRFSTRGLLPITNAGLNFREKIHKRVVLRWNTYFLQGKLYRKSSSQQWAVSALEEN